MEISEATRLELVNLLQHLGAKIGVSDGGKDDLVREASGIFRPSVIPSNGSSNAARTTFLPAICSISSSRLQPCASNASTKGGAARN
jgi:hypothetical protein